MSSEVESKLLEVLESKDIIQSKELKEIGISSSQIQNMIKKEVLKRISRGLYSLPSVIDDPYLQFQAKYKKIIFSHETALSLHGMTDVTPSSLTVTVPRDYNYQHLTKVAGVKAKRVSSKRYVMGVEEITSPYGNIIKVYNKEKTLCDVVAKRSKTDTRILREAFNSYFNGERKNLNMLMKFAKELKVEKDIRRYMDIMI